LIILLLLIGSINSVSAHHIYNEPPFITQIHAPTAAILWDEWTVLINTVDYRYNPIPSSVTITIHGIDEEYGFVEDTTTRSGYLAVPFLLRDYEFDVDTRYNVTITTQNGDQVNVDEIYFWTFQRS